jgi:2-amino-4-hydroxy-6-hydroxymethyldihydropteridine diphosphokinase
MIYHLGLGSNLGDPAKNLERARRLLAAEGLAIARASALYRTEPVGFADQPWFLNQALAVDTEMSPRVLLNAAKAVEKKMRRRPAPVDGPRSIDIDVLLAGSSVIRTASLTVPHPRLEKRNFVLVPLAEIAPGAIHPVLKMSIADLLRASPDRSLVEKIGARADSSSRAGRGARPRRAAKKHPRGG